MRSISPKQRIAFSTAHSDKITEYIQKVKQSFEIYAKFSSVKSFLDFIEKKEYSFLSQFSK